MCRAARVPPRGTASNFTWETEAPNSVKNSATRGEIQARAGDVGLRATTHQEWRARAPIAMLRSRNARATHESSSCSGPGSVTPNASHIDARCTLCPAFNRDGTAHV